MIDELPKGTTAIECECGGFCAEVECTHEEIREFGCGLGRTCCVKAFVCKLCQKRYVRKLEAPDYE